ncbi:MAG: polyprenol monophosphomannose synthase [Acidimicrobiales bacterium]
MTDVGALVVIPTYNEALNIDAVLRRVRSVLPDGAVLVVDDCSPDGTADLAEATAAELGGIDVLRRHAKAGLGGAYRAGFAWGLDRGVGVFVEMDADLQHDPSSLPGLLAPVVAGSADLVIGSRYVPGGSIPNWRLHRRLLSRWGNRYASAMLGLHVQDATAGFRAYSADLLKQLDLDTVRADGYGFQIEMTYRSRQARGRIVEVPIQFGERARGESKMSGAIVFEALTMVTWWAARDRLLRRRR